MERVLETENRSLLDWLDLPVRKPAAFSPTSLLYGAGSVAAAYAGVRQAPLRIKGTWAHGWTPDFFCAISPELAFGDSMRKEGSYWVGTKALEDYLRESGFSARAIGLPITYLPPKTYGRKPRSLLVMPAHSLEWTNHDWRFDEYVALIAALKPHFEAVAACIHTSCFRLGYWVKEFESVGVPVVGGADRLDANSLERMRALASQFEYITTNGFGSHIAYGAAFGAKVSIYGDFCSYKTEDFADDYFYASRPGLLEEAIHLTSESFIKSQLGDFFCHPVDARQRVEWGMEQIGYQSRVSPAEIRKCFGWEWHQRIREAAEKKATFYFDVACRRLLPGRVRDALAEKRDPVLADRNRELRRLKALPPGMVGTSLLSGETFHFADAESFIDDYRAIFERAEMDFPCVKASPRIIDWGAGAGLASRFWTKKYPSPEIHAFTPEGPLRQALRENIALAGNANAVMHENIEDLTDLLQGSVDFLRIDLGMTGTEILCRAGAKIKSTQRLFVVCQTRLGKQQEMSRVLSLLETCGFRYHITARRSSPNPLLALQAQEGADCTAEIWAYRGERFPRTWPLPDNKQTKAA